MFGIGETEFVIILVFAFLLFGPDKLPGIGRTIGRALRQFRDASNGFTEVVQSNIMDPAAEELKKSPKQRRAEEEAASGASGASAGAAEGSEAPQHETFAERKARLQAEREAAQKNNPAPEPQDQGFYVDDDDADSDADIEPAEVAGKPADSGEPTKAVAAAEAAKPAPEPEPEPVATNVPKPTSAADLYALGERHSSRRRAQESQQQQQEQPAEAEQSADEQPAEGSAEEVAANAPKSVATDSASGEEDGSTEA